MKQSYTGSALFQAQWNTGVLIVVLGSSAEWHCCTLWNLHSVQLWRLHTQSLCKCLLHSPSPKSERDLSCYQKWRCWPVKVVRPCCLWLQYVWTDLVKMVFKKCLTLDVTKHESRLELQLWGLGGFDQSVSLRFTISNNQSVSLTKNP